MRFVLIDLSLEKSFGAFFSANSHDSSLEYQIQVFGFFSIPKRERESLVGSNEMHRV